MTNSFFNYLQLAAAYTRFNLKAQMEYRGAFISQVLAMFLNDGVWVVFWIFFFTRFPVLHGWTLMDVISLWAVTTAGFGLAFGVMGNAYHLAFAIANGDLDLWLSHPRAVLPHLLLGRSIPTAWGDAAFGYVVYFAVVRPDAAHLATFVLLTFVVSAAFVGFGVMSGSLGFYIGNATTFSEQWKFATITFATYPSILFEGAAKMILFTVIPAGLIAYLPFEVLRSFSFKNLIFAAGGAILLLAAGVGIFYRGLRRYESGNLISMNG